MVVWIPESPELAELPGESECVEQNGARLSASHCYRNDTLLALNDGRIPSSSNDRSIPRLTFFDHKGTNEWLQMAFDPPRPIGKVRVYWFDDTGHGACRVPASWRLAWREDGDWKPVDFRADPGSGTRKDAFNTIEIEPVLARELRLEVELQDGFSAGVLEWEVTDDR